MTADGDTARTLETGQVLDGKYRIEGLIGHGGMGTVYRAVHLALGAPRAIKVVKTEMAEELKLVERFHGEALVAESLRHPNLVSLYDFSFLPDGTPYIVWELVEGETLGGRLERGEGYTAAEVVRLVGQIADGLAAAHRQGILHRDISPDNIMVGVVDGETVAKVLDFGVAKGLRNHAPTATGASLFLGKIGYASPEQMGFLGDGADLDARTDVFSLAVVCYYMLTGEPPFRATSARAYLHDVVVSPEQGVQARFLAAVEEPWKALFRRALARKREERTPSMEALKMALDGLSLSRTPPRPRRVGLSAALALSVLIGALTLFALWEPPALDFPAGPHVTTTTTTTVTTTGGRRSETSPPVVSSTSTVLTTTTAPREVTAFGQLVLTATPQASVMIGGKLMGITPMRMMLEPGRHGIELTSPSGFGWRGSIDIVAGEVTTLHRRLDRFGSLTVTADVWAAVSLDGGSPEQTPIAFQRVGEGLHEVRLFREGFVEQVHEVLIEEGNNYNLSVTMEREP